MTQQRPCSARFCCVLVRLIRLAGAPSATAHNEIACRVERLMLHTVLRVLSCRPLRELFASCMSMCGCGCGSPGDASTSVAKVVGARASAMASRDLLIETAANETGEISPFMGWWQAGVGCPIWWGRESSARRLETRAQRRRRQTHTSRMYSRIALLSADSTRSSQKPQRSQKRELSKVQ